MGSYKLDELYLFYIQGYLLVTLDKLYKEPTPPTKKGEINVIQLLKDKAVELKTTKSSIVIEAVFEDIVKMFDLKRKGNLIEVY